MASAKTGRRLPRNRGLHGVVGLARGPVAELRAAEAEELAQLMRVGMRIRHAPVQMHAASAAGAVWRCSRTSRQCVVGHCSHVEPHGDLLHQLAREMPSTLWTLLREVPAKKMPNLSDGS